ncbi:MAG TPA: amidohydrolase [Solirubrobacterales bacterium]|nr:amidohydrolase [Solirubrobacterales bacterium]
MALLNPPADVIAVRRELHATPELGFLEFRTAAKVAAVLDSLGYGLELGEAAMSAAERMGLPSAETLDREFEAAAAEMPGERRFIERFRGGMTAMVATLDGDRSGGVAAFRFDMDALPVTESDSPDHLPNREGFRSQRAGLMHACGHDGHVAIGLALAARLADRDFPGQVKLLFQPAEEGLRGAASVVASGVLDRVDRITCMHLGLGLPTGIVHGSTEGLSASSKKRAIFTGRAAHAGMDPENGANALLAAAGAVVRLHALPQYAGDGSRLNVGTFTSGSAPNIVAERAELTLETRALDSVTECRLAEAAESTVRAAGAGLGVEVSIESIGGAPEVVCDGTAAERVLEAAAAVDGLVPTAGPHRDSGSEDASWLLERVREGGGDGTYVAFGCSSPSGHHSSTFDLDEAALPMAVDLLEGVARAGVS